jgi:OOP family OmpA-OmpF porin
MKNKNAVIEIAGFTDNVGLIEDNLELSRKRVEKVASILIDNGAEKEQIILKYYGEENPISSNSTKEGRQKNRRVELKLIK